MSIKNYYTEIPNKFIKKYNNPGKEIHGIDVPFRGLIVAPSGTGKTNLLINLLHLMDDTFSRIVICCKSSCEPLYEWIHDKAPSIEFYENGDVPDINEFKESGQTLIVFDDLLLEKDQSKIIEFFIRGRKVGGGISCIYISQSYYGTPKKIRQNIGYLFILKLPNERDVNAVLREAGLGITKQQLIAMYKHATNDPMNFLMIDINNPDERMKFRHNFKSF